MDNKYKIIISNRNIYREIELPTDAKNYRVGTSIDCDTRLYKDLFFDEIKLEFIRNNDKWIVMCSDNVYFSVGDARRLLTKELEHGDIIILKYQAFEDDVFVIEFSIDFESEKLNYDRCVDVSEIENIHIGGTTNCNIQLFSPYIQQDYIVLRKSEGKYFLIEKNTRFGVYINGIKSTGMVELKNRDFFSLAEYSFYFKDNCIYASNIRKLLVNNLKEVAINKSISKFEYPHFNRSTRFRKVISLDKIKVLDPISPPTKPNGNIILQLAPAIIMLVVTILFRMVFANSSMGNFVIISVISMSLGIVTSLVSIVGERKKYKNDIRERESKYKEYIRLKRGEIEEARRKEKQILEEIYYSIEDEIRMVYEFSSDLFNRSIHDEDFLEVCLGVGKKESANQIEYKPREKYDSADVLSEFPTSLATEYKYIEDVPITLDLKMKNAIGFVGNRKKLYGILRNITIDLVTRQYYKDVKLFYIFDEDQQSEFRWIRFLPHVQNDTLGIRNIVCDTDSKNILFEYLYKELTMRSSEKKEQNFQQIVVFVCNDLGLKRHPISRFMECASQLGITFLFFEDNKEFLPTICDDVVFIDDNSKGKSILSINSTEQRTFDYNEIKIEIADKIAQKLASIYCDEVSLEGTLTKSITMFEMLNILSAEDIDLDKNWKESVVYKSLAAPLGVKSKNQIVSLDLNEKYHGPHGLVAGTTGSGKSEILQSYILSMAILFHPYEVGFVIIDFKGGGMVNQFKELPHLVGAITNIDGKEIQRSLLSIKAELKKRQSLFAEHNVNHIDAYIKLYKRGEASIPLPHLILIVDEFAELKMDQPEFMKELISAARIGRSLGIHLILATQKPSGVVDAQIWSNSKFKLCLKVQSKEDSNEVLKTPLAAEIKEPGRAYLQVGNNEIFDLFQSAYSGGAAVADTTAHVKKFGIYEVALSGMKKQVYSQNPEKKENEPETQLSAIVKHVASFCLTNGIKRLPGICLPPLGEVYEYKYVKKYVAQEGMMIPIGIFDDPNNQRQEQVNLCITDTNTFVLGSSQYGKTSLLQTMIRGVAENYSPRDVNIYIIDCASMALKVFEQLNHVGGVIVPGEMDRIKLFFKMINKEVRQRKELFSQMGITSFQSYKDAGYTDLALIMVMVDNIVAFRELYDTYDDDFLGICRDGLSVGISIIATAQQMSGIGYKYLSTFGNKYGFTCNDKSEYSSLFDRCRMEPKNVPGRALACIDKEIYEFQTFQGFEGEKEIHRVEKIKKFISEKNECFKNNIAKPIPEIPKLLTRSYLSTTYGGTIGTRYYAGLDFDTVEPVIIDILKDGYLAISGKENAGRSNYIRYVFQEIQSRIFEENVEAYIIDNYQQKLKNISDYGFVEQYTTDLSIFEIIIEKIATIGENRSKKCAELGANALEHEPLILVVVNNNGVYDSSKITKDAFIQWKNIIKNLRNMKIAFILSNIDNALPGINSSEILKYIKENKNVLYFNELSTIKLTDVAVAVQRQFKNELAVGDAYHITTNGVCRIKTPLAEEE